MAEQSEVEELQLQLESKICSIDLNGLVELAAHLNVEFKELGKLALSKKIREEVENSLTETEDKKVYLVGLLAFVNGKPPPLEGDAIANKEQVKVKHESLNQSGTLKEKTETKEPKVNLDVSKVVRRDFKIHGVVAGDNFKDGLSFVSLSRQIDAGLKAGYKENEIIDAVIRAVSPSLQLRSYLEMIQDLTLTRLRLIMKAHFKQKSGTELYQELSNLCQETSEIPQDFLVRAMSLSQQIIFVSSASDSPIKYEPSLVQSLFLHLLETGLQDEAVRAKLRPFLEKTTVSDEQLLEKINQIMSAEMERYNKMSSGGKKGLRVNQVGTSSVSSNPAPGQPGQTPQSESAKSVKKEAKPNSLVTALEAVQSDLTLLKQAFDKAHTSSERTANERYGLANQSESRRRKCSACYSASVERCDHCFKCGSSNHFAIGCRKGRGSGNERRLHPRDRV